MNVLEWIGGAPGVAKVDLAALPDDIETGQTLYATIGFRTLPYQFPGGPLRPEVVAAFVDLWNSSEIPEFQEVEATDNGDGSFNLTANDAGKPFFVSFVIGSGTNEKQVISILNTPTGGTFALDFGGLVTAPINHDSDSAGIKTALEGLATIEVDDVTVSGDPGGPWTVEFVNNLADTDVALIKGDATNLEGVNEQQTITLNSATGGTFTLGFGEDNTAAINHDADGPAVEAALELLPSIGAGNVSVSGPAGGPYPVEFLNALGKTDIENITVDGTNLTGGLNVTVTPTSPGSNGANERHIIQAHLADGSDQNGRFSFSGNASVSAGTWGLTINGGGQDVITLTDIPWDVTFAELQGLIDADSVAWGLSAKYRFFFAHIFATHPVGNQKLSDGNDAYLQIDAASGLDNLVVTIDNSGLTGGTYTAGESNALFFGGTSDYGDGSGSWRCIIDGDSTDDLATDITGSVLKTALEGLSAIGAGNIEVYEIGEGQGFRFGGGFVIEFVGDLGNQDTGFTVTTSKSVGSSLNLEVWTGYTGSAGVGEVQTLSIAGSPGSGTFGLSFGTVDTGSLAYNIDAPTLQTSLQGLSSIGPDNVLCSGGPLPDTPIAITFSGGLSGIDVEDIQVIQGVVNETVQGGNAPYFEIVTTQTKVKHENIVPNSGPNDWNTAENWDIGILPDEGDTVFITDGPDILYGLEQDSYTLARLEIRNFGTKIGLPRRVDGEQLEYRQRFLKVKADEILIGIGEGDGSNGLYFDIGDHDTSITIYNSGSGQALDSPAILIIGQNVSNNSKLFIFDGEVGVGLLPKEAAYFSEVVMYGGSLRSGDDVHFGKFTNTGGDWRSDRTELGGETTL